MLKHVAFIVSLLVVTGLCADDERIIGGTPVNIASYPYMASLQQYVEGKYYHSCGATILNSWWLLTAAHCILKREEFTGTDYIPPLTEVRLMIGNTNMSQTALINISEWYHHPKYRVDKFVCDIGLVKVAKQMRFGNKVGVVKFPKKVDPLEDPKAVGKCTIVGWGFTNPNDFPRNLPKPKTSHTLMMAELTLSTMSYCKSKLHDHDLVLSHENLCAHSNGSQSVCMGDSGGPLICNGVQWGIVSWVEYCGEPGVPGVFTRVDHYLDWMSKVMGTKPTKKTNTASSSGHCSTNIKVLLLVVAGMFY